ncbi:MAG: hypothetical protein JWO59_3299 [Chloroflexi bacterium]|nr:hypothetical protein [Chloroflexota bacterium]
MINMKLRTYVLLTSLALLLALVPETGAARAATNPGLGTAGTFAVLAYSTVTNTGPTTVTGNLGVSPGTSATGFPPGLVFGEKHLGDTTGSNNATQAQVDANTAYVNLTGQGCDHMLTGQDLGGMTLTPGVYCFSSSAQLTGRLILNALGDPSSVFIFKIGSTLTTASGASVGVINGVDPCNVFWQVGSSGTLGTTTSFIGNILALTSITLNTNSATQGGLYALNGAVTLDSNSVQTCRAAPIAVATNTAIATNTASATNTAAATSTPPGTPTATSTTPPSTSTPVASPTNSATHSPSATSTGTPTRGATSTGTATRGASITSTPTRGSTSASTPVSGVSSTATAIPSNSPVSVATASETSTATTKIKTFVKAPTGTPTRTPRPHSTQVPLQRASATPTVSGAMQLTSATPTLTSTALPKAPTMTPSPTTVPSSMSTPSPTPAPYVIPQALPKTGDGGTAGMPAWFILVAFFLLAATGVATRGPAWLIARRK